MNYILECLINLVYFGCFLCMGYMCLGFKRRHKTYEKVIIIFTIIIATAIWYDIGAWYKGMIHALSLMFVLLVYFKEKWKTIVVFYFATWVILSVLAMLLQVVLYGVVSYIKIDILESIIALIDYSILLILIMSVGKYFTEKYPGKLRDIGAKYWTFFVIILFLDAFIVVVLGDFIISTLEAERKYIAIFSYCCVVIGLLIQLVLLINTLVTRNVHKENEKLAKQFLESQNEHYQYLEKREHETKKFRHDIKNHLILLENLINNQKYDETEGYLKAINEKVSAFSNRVSVNNGIADAIFNRFYIEAQEQGIVLKVCGHFPMECYITAYDICTILSNLLSNAIQAEIEADGKEVLVSIKYTDDKVLLTVENDYVHELDESDGVFKTTKKDSLGHGYGLSNVKECVERNGGYVSISTDNKRFKVMIMMLNEDEEML